MTHPFEMSGTWKQWHSKKRPVHIENIVTGEIIDCDNVSEASVKSGIELKKLKRYLDGGCYDLPPPCIYYYSDEPWERDYLRNIKRVEIDTGHRYKAMIKVTIKTEKVPVPGRKRLVYYFYHVSGNGVELKFDSRQDCADFLKVKEYHVRFLNDEKSIPVNGYRVTREKKNNG